MMRIVPVLALAALPVLAAHSGSTPAPIAVYTEFQQPPPAAVLVNLQSELAAIMEPAGIQIEWRALSTAGGDEPVAELAVIHFKGGCNAAGLAAHSINPGALGWTHVSDGSVLPFSDIDCDGIRRFVQGGLMALRVEDREPAFGRAVARVLAHELYHVFAHTQHHSDRGVAKPLYTVEDLLTTNFRFGVHDNEDLRALRETLVAPPATTTAMQN